MEIEAAMFLRLGCLVNTSYSPQNQFKIVFQVSMKMNNLLHCVKIALQVSIKTKMFKQVVKRIAMLDHP